MLDKGYDPHGIEQKWYEHWIEKDYFHADNEGTGDPFCIVIPPPNVTGQLHMGHALNNTLQDVLTRFKRMDGANALWLPGTDHAGIATQNVVEKQLASEGLSREALGRDAFIERVWKWREEFGGRIIGQLKRLGCSCDWSRERFTMDEGLSAAVREVFVRLYEEGLIYRGDYIINWCPRCTTALSDLEVELVETEGSLWHIRYPFAEGEGFISVATTRPETMLGDTAVAVHPDDDRYRDLVGKTVVLPLMEREIPVVADRYVDMEFGSGAVKITPAHDFNDFDVAGRHDLEIINILEPDAAMNAQAGRYEGMDRLACRKAVVEDLQAKGFLEKIEPYKPNIGHCYRCKTMVEPYLSKQWFVKIESLAQPAIEAVRDGRIRIHPKSWEATYFEWMNNIRDWCISRQIWWGHRIPAAMCDACGKISVSRDEITACTHCGSGEVTQETDVLDTWFSSALWPFSTLGWPEAAKDLETWYPTSTMITGFDILFFWVARMIMMGLKFRGEVPFRDVYIHALVRDAQGKKMSKSKGNVIDPLTIIDDHGADSFRFTLVALAAQGRDISLSEERIAGYRHFMNKIWNASRFALMNLEDFNPDEPGPDEGNGPEPTLVERWMLSRLNRMISDVRTGFDGFKFNESGQAIYRFVWHEYCDWYLELVKPALYSKEETGQRRLAQGILADSLRTILRVLSPITPFIAEEIWHQLPGTETDLMIDRFPESRLDLFDDDAEREMDLVMDVISGIRNIRGEMNVPPGRKTDAILVSEDDAVRGILGREGDAVRILAKVERLEIVETAVRPPASAASVRSGVEIFVPLEGIIDVDAETRRLEKAIGKLKADLGRVQGKLSNKKFLDKAPDEIVAKGKEREAEHLEELAKLESSLEKARELKGG